ncbi:uncharacterized protein LOC142239452 [Haematobia irritans]|uniref:uncharacterized protein LOC142239452 n=1 Tax=Haematobia irritans TaxID=7368 RepID=UPI003F4F6C2C
MATMPVVWCTDPNSVNNKPTAFALHGIQLQGNVTEKQVLALRELVNAAAEGRLILPSDGTFMLLDSGISIESSIVSNGNPSNGAVIAVTNSCTATMSENEGNPQNSDVNKENIGQNCNDTTSGNGRPPKNTYILMPVTTSVQFNANLPLSRKSIDETVEQTIELEPKYSTFTPPPSTSSEDVLYEFLCCAKCMHDSSGSRCSNSTSSKISPLSATISQHRKSQSQLMLQRFLKSCERPSFLSHISGGEQETQQKNKTDAFPNKHGQTGGNVNEPHQLYDPTYSVANKYTRRYQRKHCNMSAATIARNRHHNHRHKLPMQSVKIFHNRSHACTFGSGVGGGGNSSNQTSSYIGGLAKSTTTTSTCSKTAKSKMVIPLVCDQPSLLTPAFQLPLYATINKRNATMTTEVNESEQADVVSKFLTVNAVVHDPPSRRNLPLEEPTRISPSSRRRQRKMGAVQGSLQDTVLIEMENLPEDVAELPQVNCDIVMDTLPVVKDLISFDDDAINVDVDKCPVTCEQPKSCDISSQVIDILSQPNVDFQTPKLEEVAPSRDRPSNTSPLPARSNASSRKTSFDSTCTISSMDSGFIEMQNKLENSTHPPLTSIFSGQPSNSCGRDESRRQTDLGSSSGGEKIARLNYKECLTQSRNRRKSYEEFKAMFANTPDMPPSSSLSLVNDTTVTGPESHKIPLRRKLNHDIRKLFENDVNCDALQVALAKLSTDITGPMEMATTNALESISEQECIKTTTATTTELEAAATATKVEETLVDLSTVGDESARQKPALINEFAKTTSSTVPGTHETNTAAAALAATASPDASDDNNANGHCLVLATTSDCTTPLTAGDTIATLAKEPASESNQHQTKDILRKNSDFLSKILDRQLMAKEKEKAHMRRKSYEEFKRLVRECESPTSDQQSNVSETSFKRQNSKHRKSYASFLLMRRNSQTRKPIPNAEQTDRKDSAKALQPSNQLADKTPNSSSSSSYRHNFKIYDKLVYGTIYDIIQRKNDIYNLTYQRYDKYMTYGTIYEILHRKSSQSSIISNCSSSHSTTSSGSNSDKAFHRKSLAAILERDPAKGKTTDFDNLKKSGMIYDIIQKKQQQTPVAKEAICLIPDPITRDQVAQPPSTAQCQHDDVTADSDIVTDKENGITCYPKAGHAVSYKYGTIYDILQGEKLDANNEMTAMAAKTGVKQLKGHVKNRFVVSKIDESLRTAATCDAATATSMDSKSVDQRGVSGEIVASAAVGSASVGDGKNALKATKPNKIRRLSHMLTHKSITHDMKLQQQQQHKIPDVVSPTSDLLREIDKGECPIIKSNLIPMDSEELYSRIVAKNRAKAGGGPIQKSNSLDAISTSVTISPPATPSPPRPRRSLKHHHCLAEAQRPKQLVLVKKLSLDNTLTTNGSIDPQQTKSKEGKLRRWSNQIPLKCHCDHAINAHQSSNIDLSRDLLTSWELALKSPRSSPKCTCNETFANSIISPKSPHQHSGPQTHNGGVIEVSTTEFPPSNATCLTSIVRNTCSIHTEEQLPCPCLPSRNTTNSSTPSALSNTSTSTTTTMTTTNGNSVSAAPASSKKGKSRRLSEFTRGEFLNEKP